MLPSRIVAHSALAVALALGNGGWTIPTAVSTAMMAETDRQNAPAPAPFTTGKPDDFFGTRLHTFEITITSDNFNKMPPPTGRGGRGMGGRGFFSPPSEDSGYPKVPATLRVDGRTWGALEVRYKGNSSYRGAPSLLKRSLKLDFDAPDKARTFFGMPKLNLNNNAYDPSQMREALAYDVFRHAGVPAPRTAFVQVYLTIPGQFARAYAGLFTAIEQIDEAFFKDRWDAKVGVLVKPEGLRGLPDLGDDWSAYETPYASKTTAKASDTARFISFVKFVNDASDEEFARRLDAYLDVDEFLRFLAAEVVVVNTDSPLAMNHNYWITEHPATHRAVWLPWDMNMAWGGFRSGDNDLSLHQPSAPGAFPLADRVLAVPAFLERYDAIIRDMMRTNVTGTRLHAEMASAAALIRQAVTTDPTTTLEAFERNLTDTPTVGAGGTPAAPGRGFGGRGGPPLRQFINDRIVSVNEQLDGKRPGTPGRAGRGGGFGGPGGPFGGPPPFGR